MDTSAGPQRFEFAFASAYRLPGLLFGITPSTAHVELSEDGLAVQYGPWRLHTELANIREVSLTGGFTFLKTAGPPHLSFADRGISFTTNGERGVCVLFRSPVAGIDPTRRIKHPGATLTVADPEALAAELRRRTGLPEA